MPNLVQPPVVKRQVAGAFKASKSSPPAIKRIQAAVNKAADKYKWGSKGPK